MARPIAMPVAAAPARPLELATISRPTAFLGLGLVIGLLAAMYAISIVLGLGWHIASGGTELSSHAFGPLIAIDKWLNAAAALVTLLLFARYQRLHLREFGIHADQARRQAAWALAALGGVYGALIVSAICTLALVALLPGLQDDLSGRLKLLSLLSSGRFVSTIVLLVPVAIHEEIIFRGLLLLFLHRLGCRWSLAVLLSTLVFASLHVSQGWLAIPQVFMVGLALSLFFLWSRSLLAVMAAHFLFDLLQLQLTRVLLPLLERSAA